MAIERKGVSAGQWVFIKTFRTGILGNGQKRITVKEVESNPTTQKPFEHVVP